MSASVVFNNRTKGAMTILLKKKSIDAASILIKKVRTNMLEIRKLRSELEKIMANIASEAFGELKLKEWQ